MILSAKDAPAAAQTTPPPAPPFRETFDSGTIDWVHGWETDLGRDHYRSLYRVDRLSRGFLLHDRQSYYAGAPHDYFNEEVSQIIRPCSQRGFWDPIALNWISKLLWSRSGGWYGTVPHDWASSLELEEGALMAAMLSGSPAMNECLSRELRFIHGYIATDGQVAALVLPQNGFEYGVILSALALGAVYFKDVDAAVGETAYADMRRVYRYVASNYAVPLIPVEMTCMIIRGYANACRAFDVHREAQLRDAARSSLDALASKLVSYQERSGTFHLLDKEHRVQRQLKAEIALLLAYDVTGSGEYLGAAQTNMAWILANRWDRSEKRLGGLTWCTSDTTSFFEVHQMWFLIASKYLEDYSGVSYAPYRDDAVAFLTDDNFAGVDTYEDNDRVYHAFFSYRAISRDGTIQEDPFHQWKGAYEIGASLWAMALNYDCYSEGHSWLVTQAREDSSDSWDKAIFTQRNFGDVRMTFQWDVIFVDANCAGAYSGLFSNQRGDWRILLDTSTGLSYKNRHDQACVLVDRDRLMSGHRYTVKVETLDEFNRTITLLEDGIFAYRGTIRDAKPFHSCYFGVLQDNGGVLSAKNIYVDNIEFSPTIDPPPQASRLYRSFPNPCNDGTTIEFDVKSRGRVRLDVYDAAGALVAKITDGVVDPGRYRFRWDGRNTSGRLAASGVYVCRLEAPGLKQSEKIVLAR